jgi:hypothetical protein
MMLPLLLQRVRQKTPPDRLCQSPTIEQPEGRRGDRVPSAGFKRKSAAAIGIARQVCLVPGA